MAGLARTLMAPLFLWGTVILLSFAALAFSYAKDGSPFFLWSIAVASLAYVFALAQIVRRFSGDAMGRRGGVWIVLALALALAMRLPGLYPATGTFSDTFRYLWDARLQRHGLNPYVVIPEDPQYAAIHTADTRRMNNMHVPSPYPPAAQLFFRIVTSVQESPRAFKIALVGADLLTSILLVWLLRAHRRSEWLALVYAWHPLTVLESSRNGHLDALGALLLVIAALSLVYRRMLSAVLAFTLAIGVKLLPIVLAPLFWRRLRLWQAAAGGLLLAALYVPYMTGGVVPLGSVTDVLREFRFNGPLYESMNAILGSRGAAVFAVVMGLGAAAWFGMRSAAHAPEAWAWPMAIAIAGAPIVYPWYLVWIVPFLWSARTLPLLVWSVVILSVYVVWGFPPTERWAVPGWLLMVEYGLVISSLVVSLLVSRRALDQRLTST